MIRQQMKPKLYTYIPVIDMTNKLIAEYLPAKILVEDLSKPGENGCLKTGFIGSGQSVRQNCGV